MRTHTHQTSGQLRTGTVPCSLVTILTCVESCSSDLYSMQMYRRVQEQGAAVNSTDPTYDCSLEGKTTALQPPNGHSTQTLLPPANGVSGNRVKRDRRNDIAFVGSPATRWQEPRNEPELYPAGSSSRLACFDEIEERSKYDR